MKVTTLLPLNEKDELVNLPPQISQWIDRITDRFEGCSIEGLICGRSIDHGQYHSDRSLKVCFVCGNHRLAEARELVLEMGQALDQIRMYFEVRDFDGVEFLECKSKSHADQIR